MVEWEPEVQETVKYQGYMPEMLFFTAGEETSYLLSRNGWPQAEKMLV
ncbi:hypothetical protein NXZ84_07975 [Mechercharimyces sp. CAU 1602]|nr:hypothetical protein [Mechercharimyces sp. CAU 1602]